MFRIEKIWEILVTEELLLITASENDVMREAASDAIATLIIEAF